MQRRNFSQYFWFNKLLLQSGGIMPLSNSSITLNLMPIILTFLSTTFINSPAIYSLIWHWNEISTEDIANIISEHIQIFFGALKALALLPKRKNLKKLVKICGELWETVNDKDNYQEISVFAEQALFLTIGFYLNVFCALITIALTPILTMFMLNNHENTTDIRQLPYLIGFTPQNHFKTIYGLQIVSAFISLIPIVAVDTAVVFFSLHGCAHARSCKNHFKKLAKITDDTPKKTNKSIFDCIDHHQKLLEYSDCIEDVFSGVILIQSILSLSVICGYSFNLILLSADEYFKYCTHLIGAMIQWYMYCFPAHALQVETVGIADAAYDLPWWNWSVKNCKLVKIIVLRSQKPATLSALNFTTISMQTFSSVCSTALSLFSVLRQVIE